MKAEYRRWAVVALLAAWTCGGSGGAETWRIEAEQAGDGNTAKPLSRWARQIWKVESAADASAGAYLGGTAGAESHPVATRIPHAGSYRVWVRHYRTEGKPTSFYALLRDDIRDGIWLEYLDYRMQRIPVARPADPVPEAPEGAKSAFTWSPFDVALERPMSASISFGPGNGVTTGTLGIDCVILSDDPAFDPRESDWAALPVEPGPSQTARMPKGMRAAPAFTLHSAFFAGMSEWDRQYKMGLVNNWVVYRLEPMMVQLGINHDHGAGGSVEHGIFVHRRPEIGYIAQDLKKATPSPTGRFVNAEGKVGKNFSFSYEPFRNAYLAELAEDVRTYKDDDTLHSFALHGETGGFLDYSDASRDRFRQWLGERYGTIGALNKLWRTEYGNFDQVPLPKTPGPRDSKAPWFAFREFCGLELVTFYAEKARVIAENDPRKRPCDSQASCAHIMMPEFTSTGPLDFEDLINVVYTDQPEFGWDAYSTEDYFVGCDADLLLSLLTNGQRLVNNEFNTHGQDPRIMARTSWSMIGKGLKGISYCTIQHALHVWAYGMWATLEPDFTPRDKLGAIGDVCHEVRRLERLLSPAKPAPFVKPVALYYSRLDLSLPQPVIGTYSSSLNSPYRVYSVLRGLGYPVRWVTPKLIEAGALDKVSAVVLVGVKYVPHETAAKLAKWVEDGGCIIGDQWPGAFDEHDRPQDTLSRVFGIRADEPATAMSEAEAKLKFEETLTPVYAVDPEVLDALTSDKLFRSVSEMWEQWDSTHPVATAVKNWHLSGFDQKNIRVLSGEVVGMTVRKGRPGLVINDYGKGHALYSAMMLGTLYESGPVAYEWDSLREGPGFYRIMDAYLRFSGVAPFAQFDMPERLAWNTRVELPMVDDRGNVAVGMINVNPGPTPPGSLALVWPASAPDPELALACTGGSRMLEKVSFDREPGKLTVTMPGFDTHATLLALTDSDPLIGLEISGAPRGVAGLLEVTPNTRFTITATVWNPSPRKLKGGVVKLYAAPGWFCRSSEVKMRSIKAYGSRAVTFEVAAPPFCSKRNLRPIVFKYASGEVTSSPATEMVWWMPPQR